MSGLFDDMMRYLLSDADDDTPEFNALQDEMTRQIIEALRIPPDLLPFDATAEEDRNGD